MVKYRRGQREKENVNEENFATVENEKEQTRKTRLQNRTGTRRTRTREDRIQKCAERGRTKTRGRVRGQDEGVNVGHGDQRGFSPAHSA